MSHFPQYQKYGLPHSIIVVHDVLFEDILDYFEKGKDYRQALKKARKALKKAFKIAKKNKINPAESLGEARKVFESFNKEIELSRDALWALSSNLEDALDRIKQEKIDRPLSLMEKAR